MNAPVSQGKMSTHLLEATKENRTAMQASPLVRLMSAGQLSAPQYEQVLWMHRQLLSAAEDAIWGSKAGKVKRVREHCSTKVNLLERDLVGFCDTRLDVPAPLNKVLDGWSEIARRTTAPAELLGRLFALEGLFVDYKRLPTEALAQRLGVEKMHYFGAGDEALFDRFRRFCAALDEAVVGDLAQENAVQGARDMLDIVSKAYERIGRITIASMAPPAKVAPASEAVEAKDAPQHLTVRSSISAG